MATMRAPIEFDEKLIKPGTRDYVEIPVAKLPTGTWVSMPVTIMHGAKKGPRVWLSAAIHGDEINGVEIINRILDDLDPTKLRGTIIAVPVVNVFGFISQSRYLPDGRDLNRSFPGREQGSLAGRLAWLFMNKIVDGCSLGIDFHTATAHRTNVAQIRADLEDPETLRLARAFAAPATVGAKTRGGSLRAKAGRRMPVLLFEGGEAQRYEEKIITAGVSGTKRVLGEVGMVPKAKGRRPPTFQSSATTWVRARRTGILRARVGPGSRVTRGQWLGTISDVSGTVLGSVRAPFNGMVIGMTLNPIATQGDALFNVAKEGA